MATLITEENFKEYIGKRVYVEIACYAFGIMYPDENSLHDLKDGMWHFKSPDVDLETKPDGIWEWAIEDKDCSIEVYEFNKSEHGL